MPLPLAHLQIARNLAEVKRLQNGNPFSITHIGDANQPWSVSARGCWDLWVAE